VKLENTITEPGTVLLYYTIDQISKISTFSCNVDWFVSKRDSGTIPVTREKFYNKQM
jgi:hypothetical protein